MIGGTALKVAFRVDASRDIGTGHVTRCLTLGEQLALIGVDVCFVSRELEGNLNHLIEQRGFHVHRLPPAPAAWKPTAGDIRHAEWLGLSWQDDADQTAELLFDSGPLTWLVVDHYGLDARWEERFRGSGLKVMVIDDLLDRVHACDLLLNQNLIPDIASRYEALVPNDCALLLGPSYALLQKDYGLLRQRSPARKGKVQRILVSFGGVDKDCLTEKTVRALLSLQLDDVHVDIVISSGSPQYGRILDSISARTNFHLHDRIPSLSYLILAADLAIGAGGTTNWERFCLGLPALIVTVAENQIEIADELAALNLIELLGRSEELDEAKITAAIEPHIRLERDESWSRRCMSVVDGRGAERVCAVLSAGPEAQLHVRHAILEDEALLLNWANDAVTRQNAFSSGSISAAEHKAWFHRRLRDPAQCVMYIVETTFHVAVGQVRFDKRESDWEISYSVAPEFRRRGIGRAMLAIAVACFQQRDPTSLIYGQVKVENTASSKIFHSMGFHLVKTEDGRQIFERSGSE